MRELLELVANGEISVGEAEATLAGYATADAGRFDAAREARRGVLGVLFVPDPTELLAFVTALTVALLVGGGLYRSNWWRESPE